MEGECISSGWILVVGTSPAVMQVVSVPALIWLGVKNIPTTKGAPLFAHRGTFLFKICASSTIAVGSAQR